MKAATKKPVAKRACSAAPAAPNFVADRAATAAEKRAAFMAGVKLMADLVADVLKQNTNGDVYIEAELRSFCAEGHPRAGAIPQDVRAAPYLKQLLLHPEQLDGFAAVLTDFLCMLQHAGTANYDIAEKYRGLKVNQIFSGPKRKTPLSVQDSSQPVDAVQPTAAMQGAMDYFAMLKQIHKLPEQPKPGYPKGADQDLAKDFDFRGARALVEHAMKQDGDAARRQGFIDALTWGLTLDVFGFSFGVGDLEPAKHAQDALTALRGTAYATAAAAGADVGREGRHDAPLVLQPDRVLIGLEAAWHTSAMLALLRKTVDGLDAVNEPHEVIEAQMQFVGLVRRLQQLNSASMAVLEADDTTQNLRRKVFGRDELAS